MRITFKKDTQTSRLLRIAYPKHDDYYIKVNGQEVGSISLHQGTGKYYWYGAGKNSLADGEVFDTLQQAKDAAKEYIKKSYTP